MIGLQAGCYAILVWLPSLLSQRDVIAATSRIVTVFIMAFGSFCGFAVAADLCDRIGRRPTRHAAARDPRYCHRENRH